MQIQTIYMEVFGCLADRRFDIGSKLCIIEGKNESGKSTLAEFIKFCLFGFAPRSADRKKYLSEDKGIASGWIELTHNGKTYRVSRKAVKSGASVTEAHSVTNLTDHISSEEIQNPGEYFTGLTRELFSQTAYISQILAGKTDGNELGVQIDNMFSSGDENMNIKRALKKIDDLRKVYGKKDGRLSQLEKQLAEREEQLDKSKQQNEGILSKEISLAKTEKELDKSEKFLKKNQQDLAYYRAIRKLDIFDKLHKAESELADLESERARLQAQYADGGFEPNSAYCSTLIHLKEQHSLDLHRMEMARNQYAETAEEQTKEKGKYDTFDYASAESRLLFLKKDKGSKKLLAVVFLLLALALFCASALVLLRMRSVGTILPMLLPALAFFAVILFVSMLSLMMKASSEEKEILNSCNAVDFADFMQKKSLQERQTAKLSYLNERSDAEEKEYTAHKNRYIATYREVVEALHLIGIDCREPSELDEKLKKAIESVQEYLPRVAECENRIGRKEERLADLIDQLEGEDEAALRALVSEGTAPTVELAEAERNEKFYSAQIESLKRRKHDLMLELTALKSGFVPPSELFSEISNLKEDYHTSKQKHDALKLAYETLEKTALDIRMDLLPSLSNVTTEIVSGATTGRYISIGISDDFVPSCVSEDSRVRTLDYVSSGTQDLIYLAMRISLLTYLSGRQEPLLVFDESFARMDDERIVRFFDYLKEHFNGQILILTNNNREETLLKSILPFKKIEL